MWAPFQFHTLLAKASHPSAGMPAGLVLRYKFDDTVTTDFSGNGNNGTLGGSGTTLVSGHLGSALSFNGSGYVTFASTSLLGLATNTSEISICCWINITPTDGLIVSLRDGGGNPIINLAVGYNGVDNAFTGGVGFLIRDDAGSGLVTVNSTGTVNNGAWHHVAVTRDSSQHIKLYIDGVNDGSGTDTISTGLTPDTAHSRIASDAFGVLPSLTGLMDEFQVYNRALTSTEVGFILGAT